MTAPCDAPAQDTRYRVEVIVLTHLGHAETPRDMATVRDYGDALDFLAPDEPEETEGETAAGPEAVEEPVGADANAEESGEAEAIRRA